MAELVQSQNGSSTSVVQQQQQLASTQSSSAANYSFSSSSSFSATQSASSSSSFSASSSSSSSTKVVKQTQSVSSIKQSSSSSSSSTVTSSSSSKLVSIKSSGISFSDQLAVDLGIADVNKEMERLQLRLGDEMANIHRDIFRLQPGSPEVQPAAAIEGGAAGSLDQFLVKLDSDAIKSCIDKAHDDKVKLNFDVNEFDSETINIRTVGNKIEVHATKKSKKGDEERSEEYSRVYELPNELDPSHVSSSIFKDGVLTIELPVTDALGPAPAAAQ